MTRSRIVLADREIDREQLRENGRCAAQGLHALGVAENDSVALLLRNDFAFLEATLAAGMLGAYAVPINWHFKGDEIGYVLSDCEPKVLVGHADLLARAADFIPGSLRTIVVPTPDNPDAGTAPTSKAAGGPPDALQWDTWLGQLRPFAGPPRTRRAAIIYTSGTTGRPKGVRRQAPTAYQQAAMARIFASVYGIHDGMRGMIAGPLYHSSPNSFARQGLDAAELLLLQARFDPEQTLADIERYRITNLVMVPTMFIRLLKLPEQVRRHYDVSSIRCVTHTAAPCPAEVKRRMIEWWGPVINETYGGTEVGAAVACTSQEWLDRPGTVGRAVEGTTIGIYDDAGRRLPDGEVGEIYLRCEAYPDFTYHKQDGRRREIERDGLVSVGDMGYLQDGYLYLCDRKVDMVISGGVNIYPAEIEAVLHECPGIRDCAVFGVPDEDMGESLLAAVELEVGTSLGTEQIRQFLSRRLANYKIPRRFELFDSLPREDSGKIFKRRLREPYWSGRRARI